MDWDRYKALCDRPCVMSRWMLEQTREVLASSGRGDLAAVLDPETRQALEKPLDHRGGRETDMFELEMECAGVEEICVLIGSAAAAGVRTTGTKDRGLGGFAEAWDEYRRWLLRV